MQERGQAQNTGLERLRHPMVTRIGKYSLSIREYFPVESGQTLVEQGFILGTLIV